MNISDSIDTISVNPVKKTLGALHPDATVKFLRNRALAARSLNHRKLFLNFTFACSTPGVKRFSGYMLLFRCMLAALLIVSGSFILYGEIEAPATLLEPHLFALTEIIAGGLLVIGFLTRLATACLTLLFGVMATEAVMAGVFDMTALLLCAGCVAFFIMGAGRFSCDFLIRKAIIKGASRRRRTNKSNRKTYRAYRYERI